MTPSPRATTATDAPPAAQQQTAERRDLPEHPRSVLVAEDEYLIAQGLAAQLDDLGYRVVGPVGDGDEAIEVCRRERPDMALLDIRMPKRNGLEAAEVIFRQLAIPLVILSAYSDPEYVSSGNRIGVFGYLLKPATQDQLRVGITIAWGRYLDAAAQVGEIDSLKERLEQRKIIEQAKWIVVQRKSVTEPEAMRLLQKQARNSRRKLIDIARSVIENDSLFHSS